MAALFQLDDLSLNMLRNCWYLLDVAAVYQLYKCAMN